MFKLILVAIFIPIKSYCLIDFLKRSIDSGQNLEIYADAILDVSDSISEASELTDGLSTQNKKIREITNGLREVQYTQEDINNLISDQGLESRDFPTTLYRISNRIRSAKRLATRISMLAGADPAAVSAGENIKSNAILNDIHREMVLQRLDNLNFRQSQMTEKIKELKKEKLKRDFLISQLELMQRKSGNGPLAYAKISTSEQKKSRGL